MVTTGKSHRSKLWLYIILALVLVACLWAGWRDFEPWIPQVELRENIRSTIREVVQALVQFVVPGAIVIFFGKEALAKLRGKRRASNNEA